MPPRRTRLEIMLNILRAVKSGVEKPTRIMYRTNLSWKPLMKVLTSLSDQGLVTVIEEGNHRFYEITDKGRNVLQYFSRAMESIKVT